MSSSIIRKNILKNCLEMKFSSNNFIFFPKKSEITFSIQVWPKTLFTPLKWYNTSFHPKSYTINKIRLLGRSKNYNYHITFNCFIFKIYYITPNKM